MARFGKGLVEIHNERKATRSRREITLAEMRLWKAKVLRNNDLRTLGLSCWTAMLDALELKPQHPIGD
jgi:hypothetical protein